MRSTDVRLTVILPCRNEAGHLAECLASVLSTPWPLEDLEVLVVDGASDDGSREVALRWSAQHPSIRVLDNPRRTAPAALNIGLAHATGDVIVRMDAHVRYPTDYLPRVVVRLLESGAWNVGGCIDTQPGVDTHVGRAIARAIAHPFGVGNAHFRTGARAPRWVDTVPFGCWRRDVFRRVGGFDEDLVRNQDDEHNARILRAGGRILLDPAIRAAYIARRTLKQLARMYYQYGLFKPLVVRKVGTLTSVRQVVPAAFVAAVGIGTLVGLRAPLVAAAVAALVAVYATTALYCAARAAWRDGPRAIAALVAAFAVVHVSYGWGYLVGLRCLLPGTPPGGPVSLPLSR